MSFIDIVVLIVVLWIAGIVWAVVSTVRKNTKIKRLLPDAENGDVQAMLGKSGLGYCDESGYYEDGRSLKQALGSNTCQSFKTRRS